MNRIRCFSSMMILAAAATSPACDFGGMPGSTPSATSSPVQEATLPARDGAPAGKVARAPGKRPARKRPLSGSSPWRTSQQNVPRAQQTFDEVMKLIRQKYVDAGISDEQLYSGAIEGMLGRLIQTRGQKVNALLDPDSLKEMELGLAGTLSGVGVVIKIIEEVVFVMQVLPYGPGARAGLLPGDRILAVDGKRLRGMSLLQIVKLIRGPTGSKVQLFMQRDTREWTQPVERGRLVIEAVTGKLLSDHVGLLRITTFNRNTIQQLDAQMARLTAAGVRKLVLDLRACPGGLLEVSLQAAERFLPPGKAIVTVKQRSGAREIKRASLANPGDTLPLVVLVSSSTASGAEIVAATLADHGRATLVGQPTLGKGTVETILRLRNGWALKLSVARFYSPAGHSLQGRGLKPAFQISGGQQGAKRYLVAHDLDPDQDPQIKAALRLLRR